MRSDDNSNRQAEYNIYRHVRQREHEHEENEPQAKGLNFGNHEKVDKLSKVIQFILQEEIALFILDLALVTANISQAIFIVKAGSHKVVFYYFLLVCVSLSLTGLAAFAMIKIIIWKLQNRRKALHIPMESSTSTISLETAEKISKKDKLVNVSNCVLMFIVFGVTVVNVTVCVLFGMELNPGD